MIATEQLRWYLLGGGYDTYEMFKSIFTGQEAPTEQEWIELRKADLKLIFTESIFGDIATSNHEVLEIIEHTAHLVKQGMEICVCNNDGEAHFVFAFKPGVVSLRHDDSGERLTGVIIHA